MFFFFFFEDKDIVELKNKYYYNGLFNKSDIENKIISIENDLKSKSINDNTKTPAYYSKLFSKLSSFKDKIHNAELLELKREDCWVYSIKITELRIELYLKKINLNAKNNNDFFSASYMIISDDFNLLTVEQYAAELGVSDVSVRQWIRRGKLKASKKYGNEWKISELALPTLKRNSTIRFHWENKLYGYPDGFEYINNFNDLEIVQGDRKTNYKLKFSSKNYKDSIICETQQKELLEMYLIGNVFVQNDEIIIYE